MNERLRILVLTANPANMSHLKLKDEHRLLRNKMHDNAEMGNCEILVETAARLADIKRAVETEQPHIIHFAGHGTQDSICLEDDEGANLPLSKEKMSELFNLASGRLRVVVLNACHSAAQMEELSQTVDYIIGTTSPVADDAALCFAADFYHGLATGETVREAFHQAQGKLEEAGRKTQADLYQLLIRPDADETKPLLPPFARMKRRDEIDEVHAPIIDFVNELIEGPDAYAPLNTPPRNESYEHETRIKTATGKKISFANSKRTSG
jgi:CHAT domain-containing protein